MSSPGTKPLASLARRIGGGTPSRKIASYWGGDLPWFTVADLSDEVTVMPLSHSRECITKEGLASSATNLIPTNAVVFSTRVVVGKIGIAKNPIATNQDFSSFICSEDLDPEFLAFYLLSKRSCLREHQKGATIKGIRSEILEDLPVPLLEKSKQRRLVGDIKECLRRVEEMQRLREEALAEQNLLLSATLRNLFQEAARRGQAHSIGSVTLESQYGTNVKCMENGGGTPILRIPNVAGGRVNLEKLKFAHLTEKENAKVRLRNGDLLVVRTNGSLDLVGRCAVFEEGGAFGYASYLIRFRLNPAMVLPAYASFFLQSPQGRDAIARIRQTSAGQYNVNSENLRNILMPLPKKEDQAALVDRATAVQRLANAVGKELATTRAETALRESILRDAFARNL